MTQEEKAKAYDEAIKVANKYKDTHIMFSQIKDEIFPELAESEGENIRRELIRFVKGCFPDETSEQRKVYLAWLEKQNSNVDNANKEYWRGYREGKQEILDKYAELEKQGQKPQGKSALEAAKEEKVDNQNCVKLADKVEPIFKVGQWIVWQDKCYKVNYNGCGYELVDQNGLNTSLEYGTIDENAHIWGISKDAKDGDVLASNRSIFIFSQKYIAGKPEAHCGIMNGLFLVKPEGCWTNEKYYPATKEQRDILFKKMKEAGYEWDAEKKELKKIEQKYTPKHKVGDTIYYNSFGDVKSMIVANVTTDSTDNPMYEDENGNIVFEKDLIEYNTTWSEEDENNILFLTSIIEECFKDKEKITLCGDTACADFTKEDVIDRLKSLRPQNRWKPSDEQMDVLLSEVTAWTKGCPKQIVLESLYNDLKNLK